MATGKKAFGTLIKRESTPSAGTFVNLGGLENLNWPTLETEVGDITDMEAASAFRKRVPTLNSLGPCTFDLFLDSDDTTQAQLNADQIAQTSRLYRIVGTDTGALVWDFNAYVTKFQIVSAKDGIIKASVELTPSGPHTPS